MHYRFRLAALALVAAAAPVLPACAAGGLVVRRKAVRPRRLAGSGGEVLLRVGVSYRGRPVRQVRAQALVAGGGGGAYVTLSRARGDWEGLVPVPANPRPQATVASITLLVSTDGGVVQRRLPALPMGPGGGAGPPPPPR